MLQEKASAVTDECMSRVQTGVETDLLPDQSQLGQSTASAIPSSSDPDQVHMEIEYTISIQLLLMPAVCRLMNYGGIILSLN